MTTTPQQQPKKTILEETPHTLEPWGISRENEDMTTWWIHGFEGTIGIVRVDMLGGFLGQQRPNAERIVACVNACAGLSDPAAALQAAREALETALQYESESYRPSSSGRREEMAEIRAALSQLNGEAQP